MSRISRSLLLLLVVMATFITGGVQVAEAEPTTGGGGGSVDVNKWCSEMEECTDIMKANAPIIWTVLKSYDLGDGKKPSDAVVAGIMGNIYQESKFDHNVTNEIGAYGLVQMLGGRADAMRSAIGGSTDVKDQISYIAADSFGDTSESSWPSRESGTMACLAPGVKSHPVFASDMEGYTSDDVKATTSAFASNYERPGEGECHIGTRIKAAETILKHFGGTSTAGVEGVTDENGNLTTVMEDKLTGMEKQIKLYEEQQSLPDVDKLSPLEEFNAEKIDKRMQDDSVGMVNWFRGGLSVLGYIVMMYGAILLLSALLQKSISGLIGLDPVRVVTFNQIKSKSYDIETDQGGSAKSLWGIVLIVSIITFVGALLASGTIFGFLSWLIYPLT